MPYWARASRTRACAMRRSRLARHGPVDQRIELGIVEGLPPPGKVGGSRLLAAGQRFAPMGGGGGGDEGRLIAGADGAAGGEGGE